MVDLEKEIPKITNDHDLLIRLDTRFDTLDKNHTQMWASFTEIVHKFMGHLENKVDKEEFNSVRIMVVSHDKILQEESVRDKTVIKLGQLGIKFWAGLMGFVIFLLTVYKAFH